MPSGESHFHQINCLSLLLYPILIYYDMSMTSQMQKQGTLIEWKAQYRSPPCTNQFRSAPFDTDHNNYFYLQNALTQCGGRLYCAFLFSKYSLHIQIHSWIVLLMLCLYMLSIIVLTVVMLSAIMLSVVAPQFQKPQLKMS